MAQLTARGKKVWRVQWKTHRSFSITIRCARGEAETLRGNLSRLEHLRKAGIQPSASLVEWIRSLDEEPRRLLMESGVVNIVASRGTLRELLDRAEQAWVHLARQTKLNHKQYHRSLVEYFGADRVVTSITPGDCDQFCRWLAEAPQSYGPASVAKRIKHSRQVFNFAIRHEWLTRNPFVGIRVAVPVDQERRYYISRQEAELVLKHLRSAEDKLVFALARWAGFRVGSEVRSLHWDDIDFDNLTMRVWSPKTKTYRVCPVFKELQPFLPDEPGVGEVCPDFCRNTDQFYRKKLLRAITRAGLTPWRDLLLNCRRSRATEVVEQFGVKAESDWIGHGPDISKRHYQMTLQEKIDLATGRKLKTK